MRAPKPSKAILPSLVLAAVSCGGCWTEGGVRHHLVLGLGIVTVSEGKASAGGADGAAPAAQAEHFKATGFLLGANPALRGLVVGQCERQSVCVPREADLLVDAVSWSDGRFTVVVSPVH